MKQFVRILWVVLYSLFIISIMVALFYFVTIQNRGLYFEGPVPESMTHTFEGEATKGMIVTWALISAVAGGMLMMAIYNLALCLFRRGEKAALYFSFTCIACSMRIFFHTRGVIDYVTDMSDNLLFRIQNVVMLMIMVGLICFIFTVFDGGKRQRLFRALVSILLVFTLILMFVESDPIRTAAAVTLAPIMLGICMYVIIRSEQFCKQTLPKLYLLSFIFFILGMVSRALISFELPFIAVSTNFFFMLVHSLLLADRYSKAITAVERSNEALEEKVAERTAELSRANEQLAERNATLDGLYNMRSELIATISHETKTPLAVLSVYAELIAKELRKKGVDDQTAKDLDTITDETQRISRLMDELQNHIKSQDTQLFKTQLNINELINGVARLFMPITERKGNMLTVCVPQDLPDSYACAAEITQVLFNILQNAHLHTTNGSINISASLDKSFISITVSDTGTGISSELLPHLYERGVSGNNTRTGLGLTICKEIIDAHGGGIETQSEPSKGTAIRFTLPIWKEGDEMDKSNPKG